jgi:hypothetical protein
MVVTYVINWLSVWGNLPTSYVFIYAFFREIQRGSMTALEEQVKILNVAYSWEGYVHPVMGLRHQYFIARTVLVRNGHVEEACRLLNR